MPKGINIFLSIVGCLMARNNEGIQIGDEPINLVVAATPDLAAGLSYAFQSNNPIETSQPVYIGKWDAMPDKVTAKKDAFVLTYYNPVIGFEIDDGYGIYAWTEEGEKATVAVQESS